MPKPACILLLLFVLSIQLCCGQGDSINVITKHYAAKQYHDLIITGDTIWALAMNDKLICVNANTGGLLETKVKAEGNYLFLMKDNYNNLIAANAEYEIKRYNKATAKWEVLFTTPDKANGAVFDSKNNLYLITTKGILDTKTNNTYLPDSLYNHQLRLPYAWASKPIYVIDNSDNIWVGFGFGEWGGELHCFSTVAKHFVNLRLDSFQISLNPVKSIFVHNNNVFISTGLMHFDMSGSIVMLSDLRARPIFESDSYRKDNKDKSDWEIVQGEYIGPAIYNERDGCIYFYSQNGFFKGNPRNDVSTIDKWVKIFKPKLKWSNGQPDAVGSPMNVIKMAFTKSNRLAFLSQLNGIGIFDGKTLTMVQ